MFGVTGRDDRFLLYVPTANNDPLVTYDTQATKDALEAVINSTALKDYRGKIAPRNLARSRAYTRLDLHLEQQIPTFVGKSRITLFGDIENFTNFINKKWGQQREYVFPYNAAVVQAQCLIAATPTGTAGTVAATAAQNCAQYRYSPLGGTTAFSDPSDQVYVNQSLYSIRAGIRFSF